MKKELSRRHFQIGESIKRTLMELVERGEFETFITEYFTITEVRPTAGYETATAFVSAIDFARVPEIVKVLNDNAGKIRYALAQTADLRSTPALIFKPDAAQEYAEKIDKLLKDAD